VLFLALLAFCLIYVLMSLNVVEFCIVLTQSCYVTESLGCFYFRYFGFFIALTSRDNPFAHRVAVSMNVIASTLYHLRIM